MIKKIKDVICTICNKKTKIVLLDAKPFNLYFCKECQNGFIYPQPNNLSSYYPKIYWQNLGKFSTFRQWLHNSFQQTRVCLFKKYISKGEVLDVGSGEGVFGNTLDNNFGVTNLEYPEALVSNKNVIKIDFLRWKTSKRFDAIVFLESLEHVTDPYKYLQKASSLLKPNGLIFIEYPRFESIESKILGKYWLQRDIPRHLFHFTNKGLRNIAEIAGLKTIVQQGVMSFQYSPYCLLASFQQFIKLPILNLRLGIIKNIPTLLFLLIGAPIAFILEFVLYIIGQSPVGLTILKKK